MCNVKQKDDKMDQNTFHCCYGGYVTTNQQLKQMPLHKKWKISYGNLHFFGSVKRLGVTLHPNHVTLFSMTCQNYSLLDCLKACQSIFLRSMKIRLLTFSFITAILHDVLNKNKDQQNTSWCKILARIIEIDYPEIC